MDTTRYTSNCPEMNAPNELPPAEVADRHRRNMALALLAVSAIYGAKAAENLTGTDLKLYFEIVQIAMVVLVIGLFIPVVLWKIRHAASADLVDYFNEDGFAAHALVFAQKRSWILTFFVLTMLEALDRTLSNVPGPVLLEIVLAVMLASVSILFLFKTFTDEEVDQEAGDVAST